MMRTSPRKKTVSRSAFKSKTSGIRTVKQDARLLDAEKFLLPTYKRPPVIMTHGRGAYVLTPPEEVSRFLGGIAVTPSVTRIRES